MDVSKDRPMEKVANSIFMRWVINEIMEGDIGYYKIFNQGWKKAYDKVLIMIKKEL